MFIGNTISYYVDEQSIHPRRSIPLQNCLVRDEGVKKGGQYHIFSIYSVQTTISQNNETAEQEGSLLLRVSSSNHAEASLWIEMLRRSCKFVSMSEIQPTESANHKDINISTSLADKSINNLTLDTSIETWENNPIPESASQDINHLDTDLEVSLATSKLSPNILQRVISTQLILKQSLSRSSLIHRSASGAASPSNKNDSIEYSTQKTTLSVSSTKTKTKTSYVPRSFPASKPMHIKNRFSPLSSELKNQEFSYRGFFNLGVIIIALSHFRLILDNIVKYGESLEFPWDINSSHLNQWESPKFFASAAGWFIAICTSCSIERIASSGNIDELTLLIVNYIVGVLNIVVPCLWVWYSKSHPIPCMIYLFQSVIIWMKLISYAHTNRDLRIAMNLRKTNRLSNIVSTNDLLNSRSSSNFRSSHSTNNLKTILSEIEDIEAPYISYPVNLTYVNIFYFCIAPTLCYQLNYPRSASIRIRYLLSIVIRLLFCSALMLIMIEQYVRPILENDKIFKDMKEHNLLSVAMNLLKISLPSTYVWLLSFYIYFHLWLNLLAEITRFGDREFYRDWWNSRTVETYWRLWNIPVHNWMLRHLCKIDYSCLFVIVSILNALLLITDRLSSTAFWLFKVSCYTSSIRLLSIIS